MIFSRRLILTGATATLAALAVGCSNDSTGSGATPEAASGTGAAPQKSAASQNGAGTRTVIDAMGKQMDVPTAPLTVVPLHFAAAQALMDLGVTPAAWPSGPENIIPVDEVAKVKELPSISASEPQIEAIAELEPDLILAHNASKEDLVTQLTKVAPVYAHTLRGGKRAEWWTRVDEVADAVNRSDQAQALRTEFQKRQQEMAREYADVTAGKKVAVVGSFKENNFYAWGSANMPGTLLTPLGFTWSEQEEAAVAGQPEPEAEISLEGLGATIGDADVIFFDTDLREQPTAPMQAVMDSPLWAELKAVQAGNAYPYGKNTTAGYTDAHYTLDLVEKALTSLRDKT